MFEFLTLIVTTFVVIVGVLLVIFIAQLGIPFPTIYYYSSSPGNLKKITIFDHLLYNYNIRNRRWRIPQLCEYISQKYGKVVELELLGQRVVVVTDHSIAQAFMTKHTKNLRQRFGNEDGLRKLNMHNNGLIWNNDVMNWKNNRIIFEATLNNGIKVLDELSRSYFESTFAPSITLGKPNSLLNFLRNYTVTMTMEGLFGLDCCKNPIWRDKAKNTVANYFKAWEFFLLTPETQRFQIDEKKHENYCKEMLDLSSEIYNASNHSEKPSKFIEDLAEHNTENQICQCISEMLLAGTDTSSLTMFYTTLFLADHPEVGNRLAKKNDIEDKDIAELYYESMRLVSVGPVILRQAENDCKSDFEPYGLEIILRKGDGIIFNIAGMNLDDSTFEEPKLFNPSRYEESQNYPLTFGVGKKSCVGKNFAEKEMKLFFKWFIQNYVLLGNENCMINLLQTRWDIANAPLTDIQMYVFPRRIVHLVGNRRLVHKVVHELKKLLPKIKIIDGTGLTDDNLSNILYSLKQEFAIVYGIPEEYYSTFTMKNDMIVSLMDEHENESLAPDQELEKLGIKYNVVKSGESKSCLEQILNLLVKP